jgi:hypothetical protein
MEVSVSRLLASYDARNDLFLEAKHLVEDQFPDASVDAKLKAIATLVGAYCQLFAAQKLGSDLYGGLNEIADATDQTGE